MTKSNYDIIVIGSGVGGSSAIYKLFDNNSPRIALIERGGWVKEHPKTEIDWLKKNPIKKEKSELPIEFEGKLHGRDWGSYTLGGGTLLWYGHMLRLEEQDFKMKSLYGTHSASENTSLADWPIELNDLVPFYDEVEKDLKVCNSCNDNTSRFGSIIDNELLIPLKKMGYNPFYTPTCFGGNTYDLKPVDYQGNRVNKNSFEVRPNALNIFLKNCFDNKNIDIYTNTIAKQIIFDKGKVRGVKLLRIEDEKEFELHAPIVISSCSAIESAMLFFRSKIPDPNKLIGKNLTFLTECTAQCISKNERSKNITDYRQIFGSLTIKDLYLLNMVNLFKGGKITFSDRWYSKPPISFALSIDGWGDEWVRTIERCRDYYVLYASFKGEALPLKRNRVSEGHYKDKYGMKVAKVHYQFHKHDEDLLTYVSNELKKIFTNIGGRDIRVNYDLKPSAGHCHCHGTLRFGNNPESSVLNRFCEHHRIKGLFVLDGSFMPTSGGVNSSLTIMANSYRVSKYIINNYFK